MKLYTLEEMLDKEFGPIGTAERDKFEEEVANSLNEDKMGHTLKDTREKHSREIEHRRQRKSRICINGKIKTTQV